MRLEQVIEEDEKERLSCEESHGPHIYIYVSRYEIIIFTARQIQPYKRRSSTLNIVGV